MRKNIKDYSTEELDNMHNGVSNLPSPFEARIETLRREIKKFNEISSLYSRILIALTIVMAVLAFIQVYILFFK